MLHNDYTKSKRLLIQIPPIKINQLNQTLVIKIKFHHSSLTNPDFFQASKTQTFRPQTSNNNEFRTPRKTIKTFDHSNTKTSFFTTPNRYATLDNIETDQVDTPSNKIDTSFDAENINQNNSDTQIQTTNNHLKIPPLFVINISKFAQFHQIISTFCLSLWKLLYISKRKRKITRITRNWYYPKNPKSNNNESY